jgi:hypothetical protein
VGINLLESEPLWFATCYHLSGVVTATGGFIGVEDEPLAPKSSCYAWAAGTAASSSGVPALFAPTPTFGVIVDGGDLSVSLPIGPYMGPRSYPSIPTSEGVWSEIPGANDVFDFGKGPSPSTWNPNATASAEVATDGSGSITLSNLAAEAGVGYVSGQPAQDVGEAFSEQWTCVVNPVSAA